MPKGYQPYQATIGRILGAFQGTNYYDVSTDFGRFDGYYHGNSRGLGGVMESGGLLPGTSVWVLVGEGEMACQIVGPVLTPWGVSDEDPKQLAAHPQVAGFRYQVGMAGELYDSGVAGIQNRSNDTMTDLVNGEWAISSPHGPGVGVELFRSWIRGGPMTGVFCWPDLTRVTAIDYEFFSLAQADYDRRHGNSMVESKTRCWYPSEALSDQLPREVEIKGAIHGGHHKFIAPAGERGKPRLALLHEYRGTDGAWAVTSARSVLLQRAVQMVVPEESQAPEPTDDQPVLGDQPLDKDELRDQTLNDPRPIVAATDAVPTGLTWVQRTLDIVESQLRIRGRSGMDRLPIQWPLGEGETGVPEDSFHTTYDAHMWRDTPESFEITLDPIEKGKTFYVGRSIVFLSPDGSIVIEDASHSQVVLAGGNIMFSAPHDIVLAAGRNIVSIAGRDHSTKAGRHVDLASNDGRVSIKAEETLSLLGGNGGDGGVLIESRGDADTFAEGVGTDQTLSGVLVKSKGGTHIQGARVSLDSTEQILTLRSETQIALLAPSAVVQAENGMYVYADDEGDGGYAFTKDACVVSAPMMVEGSLFATEAGFFHESLLVGQSIAAGGVVVGSSVGPRDPDDKTVDSAIKSANGAITTEFNSLKKSVAGFAKNFLAMLAAKLPLNRTLLEKLGFSFATSEQLGTNGEGAFELPEVRWQAVSRRAEFGESKAWTEKPVVSPAGDNRNTSPSPGYEVWAVSATYQLDEHDMYLNTVTGTLIPHTTPEQADLPEPKKVPLDGNYLIGDDA